MYLVFVRAQDPLINLQFYLQIEIKLKKNTNIITTNSNKPTNTRRPSLSLFLNIYKFKHSIMHPIHSNHSSHTHIHNFVHPDGLFSSLVSVICFSLTHSFAHLLSFSNSFIFLFHITKTQNMQKSNVKPHRDVYLFHSFHRLI